MITNEDKKVAIEKTSNSILTDLHKLVLQYISDSEISRNTVPIDEAIVDLNVQAEEIYKNNKDFQSLDENTQKLVRSKVKPSFIADITKKYNESMLNNPREINGKKPFNVDSVKRTNFSPIISKIKNYVQQRVNELLTNCTKGSSCPTQEQFLNYVEKEIRQGVVQYKPEDATDNDVQYLINKVSTDKEKYLKQYKNFSENVIITGCFPDISQSGSTNDTKRSGVLEPSEWAKTNVSFSGCDMVISALMKTSSGENVSVTMGSTQTLSYSVYRKLSPINAIGNINAKDYVGGPRTIAGSLIFTVFNQHWGTELIDKWARAEGYSENRKILMDEIAPIDLTVSMANEYGVCSRLAIYGVRLFSEGQVMSINDIYTENTFQYVALNIDYLADINSNVDTSGKATQETAQISDKKPVKMKPVQDGGQKEETQQPDIEIDDNKSTKITAMSNAQFSNGARVNFNDYADKDACLTALANDWNQYIKNIEENRTNGKLSTIEYIKQSDEARAVYNASVASVNKHYDN